MALEELALRTTPQYWIAAVYKRIPGRGLIFQGYTPYAHVSWPKWLDRLHDMRASDLRVLTRSYYWDRDQSKWVLDTKGAGDEIKFGGVHIGAIERRSPLPAGRYWQDIFEKQLRDFETFMNGEVQAGRVEIIKVERFNADPLRDGSWLPAPLQPEHAGTIPERTWVLFQVKAPIAWDAVKFGFPTIADEKVASSADTATNPPGPSPTEEIADAAQKVVGPVTTLLALFLGIKVVQAIRK